MTPSELAAYIGAAAWLPQIIGWVYKAFVKPQVHLVPAHTLEIGYTSLGPIFNLGCAISASRRDAVIEKITITIRHEKGQSVVLAWRNLNETFSQIRSGTGETAEVTKNQPAIALKVSTLVLVEKNIGFQELNYLETERTLSNAVIELFNHLKKTEPDFADKTLKSKQFADLLDFYQKRMYWQEGRYVIEMEIRITGNKKPIVQYFEFGLSRNDIDRLVQNVAEVKRFATELVAPLPKEKQIPNFWNWVYPGIRAMARP
jgi:hypothetical protein